MSRHECPVVKIKLEEHPNADALSLVRIHGYQCAVKTDDWKDGALAAYIPPDSIVPDTDQFAFLKSSSKNWNRIRVRRLRGHISMGLLVPAPDGSQEGDNAMEALGVTHYEPPIPLSTGGDNEVGPSGWYPKYDVENFRRYNTVLQPGEEVVATEKIHGANARYVWSAGRIWAGSRTNWKKEDSKSIWWQALKQNPWIEEWCKNHPKLVLYGEVFGQVQNLKYGAKSGEIRFLVFDILDGSDWMSYDDMIDVGRDGSTQYDNTLQFVPELYRGNFDAEKLEALAEGDSTILGADHIREGIVVKTVVERRDSELGRVQLKMVSNAYLAKN